jgi:hypothetical protein
MIPDNLRRIFVLIVPAITTLSLLGVLDSVAKLDENIAATGVTMKIVLSILNVLLLYLIYRRRVP